MEINRKLSARARRSDQDGWGVTPFKAAPTRIEPHAEAIEATLDRIEARLAAAPTRDNMRNGNLAVGAAVIASVLALGAFLLAASGSQLIAFQADLAAQAAMATARP